MANTNNNNTNNKAIKRIQQELKNHSEMTDAEKQGCGFRPKSDSDLTQIEGTLLGELITSSLVRY